VRRFLAILLMCLLPLQSLLAFAAPTCGLLPAASAPRGAGQSHIEGMHEAHHGHHAVMAHHADHDGAGAFSVHSEPCPHAGLHPADSGGSGQPSDQADCDGLLHCMGSHLVPFARVLDVQTAALTVRDLLVPGLAKSFRSTLTEPLHRPPIARAA
jgi:hypothetical protein